LFVNFVKKFYIEYFMFSKSYTFPNNWFKEDNDCEFMKGVHF